MLRTWETMLRGQFIPSLPSPPFNIGQYWTYDEVHCRHRIIYRGHKEVQH